VDLAAARRAECVVDQPAAPFLLLPLRLGARRWRERMPPFATITTATLAALKGVARMAHQGRTPYLCTSVPLCIRSIRMALVGVGRNAGMLMMIFILRYIRLSNIKIATVVLMAALVYDVFWVLIQPRLTNSRSVMLMVATSTFPPPLVPPKSIATPRPPSEDSPTRPAEAGGVIVRKDVTAAERTPMGSRISCELVLVGVRGYCPAGGAPGAVQTVISDGAGCATAGVDGPTPLPMMLKVPMWESVGDTPCRGTWRQPARLLALQRLSRPASTAGGEPGAVQAGHEHPGLRRHSTAGPAAGLPAAVRQAGGGQANVARLPRVGHHGLFTRTAGELRRRVLEGEGMCVPTPEQRAAASLNSWTLRGL
jgi:hypothetical protein